MKINGVDIDLKGINFNDSPYITQLNVDGEAVWSEELDYIPLDYVITGTNQVNSAVLDTGIVANNSVGIHSKFNFSGYNVYNSHILPLGEYVGSDITMFVPFVAKGSSVWEVGFGDIKYAISFTSASWLDLKINYYNNRKVIADDTNIVDISDNSEWSSGKSIFIGSPNSYDHLKWFPTWGEFGEQIVTVDNKVAWHGVPATSLDGTQVGFYDKVKRKLETSMTGRIPFIAGTQAQVALMSLGVMPQSTPVDQQSQLNQLGVRIA